MSSRKPLTEGVPADKREAILRASLELIDENGFHGTSMAAIAEHASVGAGTIYRHFEGKEDLINVLYAEARAEVHRKIIEQVPPDDRPLKERIHAIWRALIRCHIECPTLFRFCLQYESSPYIRESTREEVDALREPFRRMEAQGEEAGILRTIPTEVRMAFATGTANRLVVQHLNGDITLDDELIDETFDMLWRAVSI